MTHSPRLGGHGGRGHQVSRKTVRQRRAAGIQPKRGHNFDNRLRNVERLQSEVREAKAYQPFDPDALIASLLSKAPETLRDDIGQELWVLALQGATEPELRAAYREVRTAAAKMEWGDYNAISLDAPIGGNPESGLWAEIIDERGSLGGKQAPLSAELAITPEWKADAREIRREQERLTAQSRRRSTAQRRRRAREAALAARTARKAEAHRLRVEARELRQAVAAAAKAEAHRLRVEARAEKWRLFYAEREQAAFVERFYAGVRKAARPLRNIPRIDVSAYQVLIGMRRAASWRSDVARAGWSDSRKVEHGRKHRKWWDETPQARIAMAEKNHRMWLAKGDQIAIRLKESGTDWWARQPPEVREQRREVMRQVWARRRAAQAQAAA